jgi:hypothetical protein
MYSSQSEVLSINFPDVSIAEMQNQDFFILTDTSLTHMRLILVSAVNSKKEINYIDMLNAISGEIKLIEG